MRKYNTHSPPQLGSPGMLIARLLVCTGTVTWAGGRCAGNELVVRGRVAVLWDEYGRAHRASYSRWYIVGARRAHGCGDCADAVLAGAVDSLLGEC